MFTINLVVLSRKEGQAMRERMHGILSTSIVPFALFVVSWLPGAFASAASSAALFWHVEVVPDGETIELTLPKWNEWYWTSGRLDADNELVLALWLRHEK